MFAHICLLKQGRCHDVSMTGFHTVTCLTLSELPGFLRRGLNSESV